jgi:AcrR family transcriptional regulator
MSNENVKEQIIDAFISVFNEYGHKVTLDKVAAFLHISKKTIYKYFASKEEIYDYILLNASSEISAKQKMIYEDKTLSIKEKISRFLTIETNKEKEIDIAKLNELEVYDPVFYKKLITSYEKNWGQFIVLLNDGIKEKAIKENTNPLFIVSLLTSGMEMLYKNDFLKRSGLTYSEAIKELASTILGGIYIK